MPPRVLPTHSPALFEEALSQAVIELQSGRIVAVPTETVYGLTANALDPEAVEKIFTLKGRPSHNPIIVHVASAADVHRCAAEWPGSAEILASRFWPGPVTLVVPKTQAVPGIVTAGGNTVGLRWPSHPFMQALIRRCGFPLAAPSANSSNRLSPTQAEHVAADFQERSPLIIDGGACQVGIESTVVDVSSGRPRVLRPGMITEQDITAVLRADARPGAAIAAGPDEGVLRSPGLLSRHYQPKARVRILKWSTEQDLNQQLALLDASGAAIHFICHTRFPASAPSKNVHVAPAEPEAYARALYAQLHACDQAGASWIVVEALPNAPGWEGIQDRLIRASAPPSETITG
ncbi:MAG: threonylcarbamoyl-AMP synthase [Verrucomicrobia bacterium]|nr:threonylcarbamoyl-AMP synthase [Verrucomicrobiota bacterium]